jgi:hypothetical protein
MGTMLKNALHQDGGGLKSDKGRASTLCLYNFGLSLLNVVQGRLHKISDLA